MRRFRDGDVEEARALDAELRPSIELLRVAPNPIAIKAALNLLGHEVGGHRLPLVEATPRADASRAERAVRAPAAASSGGARSPTPAGHCLDSSPCPDCLARRRSRTIVERGSHAQCTELLA